MTGFKKQRVGELVYAVLAEEVRQLGDGRLDLLSISAVEMTPDLKQARVFWTILELGNVSTLPTPEKIAEIDHLLEEKSFHFKQEIAHKLKLRYTPKLVFKYDHSLENAARIEELVKKAGGNS